MKQLYLLGMLIVLLSIVGCETVHDGLYKGGEYVGKGVDAAGGVTEGAVDGYVGEEENNPFDR